MVIEEGLKIGIEELKNNEYIDPLNESRYILSFLLKRDISFIHSHPEYKLSSSETREYLNIINKRKNNIPLQYITNTAYFYGKDFYVDERVLIPRNDTEILVEKSVEILNTIPKPKVLELGVGSGIISLTIGRKIINSKVHGVDISSDAINVANINKERLNVGNVEFFKSNLFENIKDRYDIIVSNPPYINKIDMENLQEEVKKEPYTALYGGVDGLDFYRDIISKSSDFLKPGGYIIFEIGYDQYSQLESILKDYDFKDIDYKLDIQGYKRVIYGRL